MPRLSSIVLIVLWALSARGQDSIKEVAESSDWLALGHYHHSSLTGKWHSDIDDDRYFLAPTGRDDPEAELRTTVEQFARSEVACRYPARRIFLSRHFSTPAPRCPDWEKFRDGIAPQSVTYVFSSYYLNNPSSALGHTFLRFNRDQANGNHQPLLDYGIGFALAYNTSRQTMTQILGALTGTSPGEISSIPYYLKVEEYANFESRDLWEYDLRLSQDEVQLLLAHLWELAHLHLRYRYLTQNCASLLLDAIGAAAPHESIKTDWKFWTLPSDTVKRLMETPGLVSRVQFRPSKRSQFLSRLEGLQADSQKKIYRQLKDSQPRFTEDSAGELDTLIDYLDYRYRPELTKQEGWPWQTKNQILIARSQITEDTVAGSAQSADDPPHLAHAPTRFGLGYLSSSLGERSYLLNQRFALHDFLDPQAGFPRDAAIGLLDFGVRILQQADSVENNQGAIRVDHFYIFDIKSHPTRSLWIRPWSWQTRFGAERTWDASCTECVATTLGAAGGISKSISMVTSTLLLASDLSASSEFVGSPVKFRLGPEFDLRVVLSPRLIADVNLIYLHMFFVQATDAFKVAEEVRWGLSQSLAISLQASELPRNDTELAVGLYFYY